MNEKCSGKEAEEAHRLGKLSYSEFVERMEADLSGDDKKVEEINATARAWGWGGKPIEVTTEEMHKAEVAIAEQLQFQLMCREKDVIGYQKQADKAIAKMLETDKKVRELEKQIEVMKADRGFIVQRVTDLALMWMEVEEKKQFAVELMQHLKNAVEGKV